MDVARVDELRSVWEVAFAAFKAAATPVHRAAERSTWDAYYSAVMGPGPHEPIRMDGDQAAVILEAEKDAEGNDGKVNVWIGGVGKRHPVFKG